MKRLSTLLLAVTILFSACDTDFDITAPYKEQTVVYGLLDINNNDQIIRIQKAFLDESTSALILADIADSIYYVDSLVTVELRKLPNGSFSQLTAVTISDKEDGTFSDEPYIGYKYSQTLDEDASYEIRVTNNQTGNIVTASTPLVQNFRLSLPPDDELIDFDINFTAITPGGNPRPVDVQWRSAVNGKVYDVIVRFYYEEWNISTPNQIDTLFVDWTVISGVTSDDPTVEESLQVSYDGLSFYPFLKSSIAEDPNKMRRAVDKPIEYRFSVGAETLYDFIRVNQAQSGVTQLQAQIEFTNIEGGLGVFSSRSNKVRGNLGMASTSLDSLTCGSFTRNLNFINSNCIP